MNRQPEEQSATVLQAKQVEEARRRRWSWVERSVWTDRMLAALENGVKGGKWFSLMDKVWKPENLHSAWMATACNDGSAGSDKQTIEQFNRNGAKELERLGQELKTNAYRANPALRAWIAKEGSKEQRPLGIPTVRDRVVQGALRNVVEPIFEREFANQSYGFRPGRGCKDALRRVDGLLDQGYTWVVDADLKSYFDTIPHERLMERVKERIADGRVLELMEKYLKAGVLEGLKGWQPTESGTPQGAVISPLLANIYLDPLDKLMAQAGLEMSRYADDFVVQCRTREQAERALEVIRQWVEANGLTLHPHKTKIVDATQKGGFDFLGYHFERGMKWPRQKSLKKIKASLRAETLRTNGQSLKMIFAKLNPKLRGWYGYFKHSKKNALVGLDGWLRGRLRSILRKRSKRKGRARGKDHQRWPNAYFEELGLFCLANGPRTSVSSQ